MLPFQTSSFTKDKGIHGTHHAHLQADTGKHTHGGGHKVKSFRAQNTFQFVPYRVVILKCSFARPISMFTFFQNNDLLSDFPDNSLVLFL